MKVELTEQTDMLNNYTVESKGHTFLISIVRPISFYQGGSITLIRDPNQGKGFAGMKNFRSLRDVEAAYKGLAGIEAEIVRVSEEAGILPIVSMMQVHEMKRARR